MARTEGIVLAQQRQAGVVERVFHNGKIFGVVLLIRKIKVLPDSGSLKRIRCMFKSERIANAQIEIQIVDTHEILETRVNTSFQADDTQIS